MSNTESTVDLDLTPDLAARVEQAVSEVEAMDNRRTRGGGEMLKKFAARLTEEDHGELERALSRALKTDLGMEKETEC